VTERGLRIRLLGSPTIIRGGIEQALPASRKVRALLAFLAVAEAPVLRSRLCDLLWDAPGDPRAALRWALSKLRGVLDDEQLCRVQAAHDTIWLDLSDCLVDAVEIVRTADSGPGDRDLHELRRLDALFAGEFAEGLDLDRNPQFSGWLNAQRRKFRACRVALLEQLATRSANDANESLRYLERWLQLAPFDERAHDSLLAALLRCGRIQEGEEHLAAAIRLFETEGLDWLPIREVWRTARRQAGESPSIMRVSSSSPAATDPLACEPGTVAVRRASICVMPFVDRTPDGATRGGLADGFTDDIITRLAKLRMLFVIARGSVYALGDRQIPPHEAARLLNVDYVVSGWVRQRNDRIVVTAELAETRTAGIVWAEDFTCRADDALAVLDEIGNKIVASIAQQIEVAERNRALLKPPGSLNAWEAYHRGLWHMYRFNGDDNARAAHFFRMALRQDRSFAPAHAGLSFTHFQNAFLHRPGERDAEIELAYRTAAESVVADDRDPSAHWALGRALWLRGAQDEALTELQRCVTLSPNFALAHYTIGFLHGQAGDPHIGIAEADYSRQLSPFDPLLFAMFCSRALALVRLGQYEEAAGWAIKGAARPNAHVHIHAIAASCLGLAGRFDEARAYVTSLRKSAPSYRLEDFLRAFRLAVDATALFQRNAAQIGLE
jgi:TolB-like protein